MKASEVIEKLTVLMNEHGDCVVCAIDSSSEWYDIRKVVLKNTYPGAPKFFDLELVG